MKNILPIYNIMLLKNELNNNSIDITATKPPGTYFNTLSFKVSFPFENVFWTTCWGVTQ